MKKMVISYGLSAFVAMGLYGGGHIYTHPNQKHIQRAQSEVKPIEIEKKPYTKWYIGGGIGRGKVNTYYFGKDTITSASLNAGYKLFKNLDIEARIYRGIKDGPSLRHSYSVGVFAKPYYEVVNKVELYALLGYGRTKLGYVGSFSILDDTTTQNDWMYGLGVSYKLNNFWSIYGDMTRLIDKSTRLSTGNYAAKAIISTVGFNYQF